MHKVHQILRGGAFGFKVGRKFISRNSTSTLIFGKEGKSSALHMDWSDAINLAIEVRDKSPSNRATSEETAPIVAIWAFIHPKALDMLNSALRDLKISNGTKIRTYLTPPAMKTLQARMGKCPETGHYWLTIREQRAGEIVHVPCGWAHAVYNVKVRIKIIRHII